MENGEWLTSVDPAPVSRVPEQKSLVTGVRRLAMVAGTIVAGTALIVVACLIIRGPLQERERRRADANFDLERSAGFIERAEERERVQLERMRRGDRD